MPYDDRGVARGAFGLSALVAFVVAAAVLGLTLSVPVKGAGMEPTLHDGDRLEVSLVAPHDISRFDLVEMPLPGGLIDRRLPAAGTLVTRVLALPGDWVAIRGGVNPVVYVRPAGRTATYRVENPTWRGRIGSATAACCTATVKSLRNDGARRWARVPADHYFVLGDNWGESVDSRQLGPVARGDLKRLVVRIQPLGQLGGVDSHLRLVPVLG